jgi:hypothetical protein
MKQSDLRRAVLGAEPPVRLIHRPPRHVPNGPDLV